MTIAPMYKYLRYDEEKKSLYLTTSKDHDVDGKLRVYSDLEDLIENHLNPKSDSTIKFDITYNLVDETTFLDKAMSQLEEGEEITDEEMDFLQKLENDSNRIKKVMLEIGKMFIEKDEAVSIWSEVSKNLNSAGVIELPEDGWLPLPEEDQKIHEYIVKFYDVKDRIILPHEVGNKSGLKEEELNDPEYKKSFIGGVPVTRDDEEFNKKMHRDEAAQFIKSYEEHLDVLYDTLKYAKEDLQHVISNYEISDPEKRIRAEEAVEQTEKEIHLYREKLSMLRKL